MPKLIHNQTNFTAGELTPRMRGRGDVARYQEGAETIENGKVVVHGGVMRREGLRYLATAKHAGTYAVRLIRYVYSVDQSFILEFGNLYVRIFDGITGAVILNSGLTPLELVSPYTADQLPQIRFKQNGDTMFLFHLDVPVQRLRRLTALLWTLLPVDWVAEPFSEIGHSPDAVLTLSLATVGVGRTFTTAPTTVPAAPTIGIAYPLNAAASVNFTPPVNTGGLPILSYTATSTPGSFTGNSASSPIRVSGLTNGVSYTFTVVATNSLGNSVASAASNAVTPDTIYASASITATATPLNFSAIAPNGEVLGIFGPVGSGSGGIAPYTHAWEKISGSTSIVITTADDDTVIFSSAGLGTTNYASFRDTVTDALGTIGIVDVTISVLHRADQAGVEIPPGGYIP